MQIPYFAIEIILVLLSAIYVVGVGTLQWAWVRQPEVLPPKVPVEASDVVVLVAARNEADNLPNLLNDLERQTAQNFHVCIVDDHSTDATPKILQKYVGNSNFKLCYLKLTERKNPSEGKKAAIAYGIEQTDAAIVLSTDGDCRLPPDWVATYHQTFTASAKLSLISGPVAISGGSSVFDIFQVVEFASLVGVGAGTIFLGAPTMASAANLAYRRSAFIEVGGYSGNAHLASGDDEFLLHKINQKFPQSIAFLKSAACVVSTNPQPTWSAFAAQRKRWASKWTFYKGITPMLVAIFIFLYHATFLCWPIFAWFTEASFSLFLAALSARISIEYLFLRAILQLENKSDYAKFIPAFPLGYSAYAVLFGLLGTFGSYQWKGRNYS